MRTTYLLCWLGITTGLGAQPLVLEDSFKLDQFEEIVVTASRLEQKVSSVSLPLVVVKAAELQRMGSLRLDQVLREQTGLVVVNDHGLGLQMQGLKPEYTLILLNGEPLIGRTAGTLDLSRLSVGNVERIEILKGPSSSLYGSEALGGVVNIITQTPKQHRLQASARYGSNRSSDFALQGHYHRERFQAQVFLNRYASGGYDLSPQVFGQTVEPFASYTAQTQLHYQIAKPLAAKMQFRYAASEQGLKAEVLSAQGGEKIGGRSLVRDLQANPWLDWQIHPCFRAQLRGYYSFYHTQEVLYRLQGGGVFDSSFFHQQFLRPEFQGHYRQGGAGQPLRGQ
jgi:outer membrane receptor for ferrienterochelin and colicins